jgi:acetyltransferase-like isoleucine patch superfamily enzyme
MITIEDGGSGNEVALDQRIRERLNGMVRLVGNNNRIEIGPFAFMPRSGMRNVINITMTGAGNVFVASGLGSVNSLHVHFVERGSLRIGKATTFNAGCEIFLHEPSAIEIGEDCMIAGNVRIHTSDMHAILNVATGERLNPAKDISIGQHVWLGNQVVVAKGVTMGRDSIAAQRALVAKDVPANTLVGGVPARVLKSGVTWSRQLAQPAPS